MLPKNWLSGYWRITMPGSPVTLLTNHSNQRRPKLAHFKRE